MDVKWHLGSIPRINLGILICLYLLIGLKQAKWLERFIAIRLMMPVWAIWTVMENMKSF